MERTPLDELRAIAERHAQAKRRLDDLAAQRRAAVLAALEVVDNVSAVARAADMTREHVQRIRDGVSTGRRDWRSTRGHDA